MKHRQLNNGIIISITIVFFVILEAGSGFVLWKVYQDKKNFILKKNSEFLRENSTIIRKSYEKLTRLLFDEIINTPEIIDLYKKAGSTNPVIQGRARDQLYKTLLATYQRLKGQKLKQLHFHLPDSTSFLRFHKPVKYGDNLTGIRYSIDLANREKRYVSGFEEGRVYNGFRHVYPLFDEQGNHLGSVETSLSSRALREDLEAITGNKTDFVIKKSIIKSKVWKAEQSNYIQSRLCSLYMNEKRTDRDKQVMNIYNHVGPGLAEQAEKILGSGKDRSIYYDGYIISFMPIPSVKGDSAAAYLINFNKTNVLSIMLISFQLLMIFATVGAMLTTLVFYLLLKRVRQIQFLATRDMLTGLVNRSSMTSRLENEIDRSLRTGSSLSLIFADIDHFKLINDMYGHSTGDEVLKQVSSFFMQNVRKIDSVARWGGEEFLILLPYTDLENAVNVAEKLRETIGDITASGKPQSVTCSFGVVQFNENDSLDEFVDRADQKLYLAKERGRNRVCA